MRPFSPVEENSFGHAQWTSMDLAASDHAVRAVRSLFMFESGGCQRLPSRRLMVYSSCARGGIECVLDAWARFGCADGRFAVENHWG